ncbi:MAG TPA: hypothetical protein VNL98_09475 [Gemmatimonadales bacterium]|nr:hypothetical protein [Gemmatimonadales bacterium]
MKMVAMAAVAAALAAQAVAAQQPGMPMPDSMRPMPMMPGHMGPMGQGPGPARLMQLRQQIEERFGQMVQNQLNLTDQQMDRVRQAMRANQDRRRDLDRREMDLHRAIGGQLQPGVAANNDSLNRMLDQLVQIRAQRAQSDQQFMRDLSFLTPVQRARFMVMLHRFEQRVREVRGRMGRPDQPGRPMMQPRRPGGPMEEF